MKVPNLTLKVFFMKNEIIIRVFCKLNIFPFFKIHNRTKTRYHKFSGHTMVDYKIDVISHFTLHQSLQIIGLKDNSDWKGSQEVSGPTSCTKQGKL